MSTSTLVVPRSGLKLGSRQATFEHEKDDTEGRELTSWSSHVTYCDDGACRHSPNVKSSDEPLDPVSKDEW